VISRWRSMERVISDRNQGDPAGLKYNIILLFRQKSRPPAHSLQPFYIIILLLLLYETYIIIISACV